MRLTAQDIEIAVADHYDYRSNLIVPNVSWGLFDYGRELDLVIVRPSGYAVEVEIKVSAGDIKRDKRKRRHLIDASGYSRDRDMIREKYFAVPDALVDHPDIPEGVGILRVREMDHRNLLGSTSWGFGTVVVRRSKINKTARRLTDAEVDKLFRLGCLRIWTLKKALQKHRLESPARIRATNTGDARKEGL